MLSLGGTRFDLVEGHVRLCFFGGRHARLLAHVIPDTRQARGMRQRWRMTWKGVQEGFSPFERDGMVRAGGTWLSTPKQLDGQGAFGVTAWRGAAIMKDASWCEPIVRMRHGRQ